LPSNSRCEEFAVHFRDNIDTIRANLQQPKNFSIEEPLCEETLEKFVLVDAQMLYNIISKLKPATCISDPIPTSFFKVYSCMDEHVLHIVNCSLQTGVFPQVLKTTVVKPYLKRNNLDPWIVNNYRPVSNLPFLSKILEKLVFNQLNEFLDSNQFKFLNSTNLVFRPIIALKRHW